VKLPVDTVHVGWVTVLKVGCAGVAFTVKLYVAVAATQGAPDGLFVVTVIVTVLPTSPAAGVYVKLNGELPDDAGLTVPAPFSAMVTLVAVPPKVLFDIVTGVVPQVLPLVLLKVNVGGLTQPQLTLTLAGNEIQPATFLAVTVCEPFDTALKLTPL